LRKREGDLEGSRGRHEQPQSPQPQTPPPQPQPTPNKNGWYYTTESFGSRDSYKVIKNDGLTDENSRKTGGVIDIDKYWSIMNMLPDPSKKYKSNEVEYKMIYESIYHELKWQNISTKELYHFSTLNPLQINIGGRQETLSIS
jgi:hypothetical protein